MVTPERATRLLHVAMIGTRGVPARYGGFETAVEEIGARMATWGHAVTVYARGPGDVKQYRGMTVRPLPALAFKSMETLSRTFLSVLDQQRRPADVVIAFNSANAPLLPLLRLRHIPTAINVDGLEWKRSKWGPIGRRYYRVTERLAARWAEAVITDARALQLYYATHHSRQAEFIPYGAKVLIGTGDSRLAEVGLEPRGYHLVVARLEPENNIDLVLDAYLMSQRRLRLVVVGSVPYSNAVAARLTSLAQRRERQVVSLGSVWDQALLDELYANATTYIHGHSVGGTNPSLLRAMGAGAAVLAIDNEFNREVLAETGWFFSDAADLAGLLDKVELGDESVEERRVAARMRVASEYVWDEVARRYEDLCLRLARQR